MRQWSIMRDARLQQVGVGVHPRGLGPRTNIEVYRDSNDRRENTASDRIKDGQYPFFVPLTDY